VNLVKWVISIAIVLRIVGSPLSLVGSGRRRIMGAKLRPNNSVAAIQCWWSPPWAGEMGK